MYKQCTFEEEDAFSDYYVSTSKHCHWFHKVPKNIKWLRLDANSICLLKKGYWKIFKKFTSSRSSTSTN